MTAQPTTEAWSPWPFAGFAVLLFVLMAAPPIFEDIKRDDPARNIEIPKNLLHEMQVKAAYNDSTMFFRFRVPADQPHYYHDYWIFQEDGTWLREGASPAGRQRMGFYEDRITFFLDDGAVPEFARYGGFITVSGKEMRFFTDAAREDVQQHPYLGVERGQSDVRKFLPETRDDPADWRTVKSPEELRSLQEAGYFLDLWHWRSHRSQPVGYSDDQFILDFRWSDEGRGMYFTNWDDDAGQPVYMFDPAVAGHVAMDLDRAVRYEYPFEEPHTWALIQGNGDVRGNIIPFDPEHDWQPGDVIPRRVMRVPSGSRGAIQAAASFAEGAWHVDLWRALDTGSPLDDKVLRHGGLYHTAFAAHINATGSRWHYVSFPYSLGLGREADLQALRFAGAMPPWDRIEWFDVKLFYPGQINWAHLTSSAHAGSHQMERGASLRVGHDERVIAQYAVEGQFRDEIVRRWTWSAIATVLFVLSIGLAGSLYYRPRTRQGGIPNTF
jgi:hypothetical protein